MQERTPHLEMAQVLKILTFKQLFEYGVYFFQ